MGDARTLKKGLRDSYLKYAAGADIDSHRHSIRRQVNRLLAVTTPKGNGSAVFLSQPWPVCAVHTRIARHRSPESGMESYLGAEDGADGALFGAVAGSGVADAGGGASVNRPLTTGLRSSPSQSS
jgi:hypothetical protein